MALAPAQQAILKNDILVTRAATVFVGATLLQHWNAGADGTLRDYYNSVASPADPIWRADIMRRELIQAMSGSEYLSGTTAADVARRALLDVITREEPIDATIAQVRTNFGLAIGATTQAAWSALAKRNATNLEQVFTGAAVGGAKVSTAFGERLTDVDIAALRSI